MSVNEFVVIAKNAVAVLGRFVAAVVGFLGFVATIFGWFTSTSPVDTRIVGIGVINDVIFFKVYLKTVAIIVAALFWQ